MMQMLIAAGLRLAETLRDENDALSTLDFSRAAQLAANKVQAADGFAAAQAACQKAGAAFDQAEREIATRLAEAIDNLARENRAALERSIALQSRVIETIAGAANAAARRAGGSYGASGYAAAPYRAPALALSARL